MCQWFSRNRNEKSRFLLFENIHVGLRVNPPPPHISSWSKQLSTLLNGLVSLTGKGLQEARKHRFKYRGWDGKPGYHVCQDQKCFLNQVSKHRESQENWDQNLKRPNQKETFVVGLEGNTHWFVLIVVLYLFFFFLGGGLLDHFLIIHSCVCQQYWSEVWWCSTLFCKDPSGSFVLQYNVQLDIVPVSEVWVTSMR